jgi:2-polyprenyl-3-methyl-5-hydroxy-6-metoxy-1,4-benzoquinol methylase
VELSELLGTVANAAKNLLAVPKELEEIAENRYTLAFSALKASLPPGSTYAQVLNMVKGGKILELGCSSGYFGLHLKRRYPEAEVVGVDIDNSALKEAERLKVYRALYRLDLDTEPLEEVFCKHGPFKTVLAMDVVEHLKNPNFLMEQLLSALEGESEIIVSIPNVGHLDVIYNLLIGRFNYSLLGILDNTHLRFFTESSFIQWVETVAANGGVDVNVETVGRVEAPSVLLGDSLPRELQEKVVAQLRRLAKKVDNPNLLTSQFIFRITLG